MIFTGLPARRKVQVVLEPTSRLRVPEFYLRKLNKGKELYIFVVFGTNSAYHY